MKLLTFIFLIGLLNSCNNSDEIISFDKIILTKGTFRLADEFQENFPDSMEFKSPESYFVFDARSILKITNREFVVYLDEYQNGNRGYYKGVLNDTTVNRFNKLINKVKLNSIEDPILMSNNKNMIYDGYSYFLFLTNKNKTERIEFIDPKYYKKEFFELINFLDNLDEKTILHRLQDSTKVNDEFNELIYSIVHSQRDKFPHLKNK